MMRFEKMKCSFEIKNLETSESFLLLQIIIVSVALSMGKIKTFHWISN